MTDDKDDDLSKLWGEASIDEMFKALEPVIPEKLRKRLCIIRAAGHRVESAKSLAEAHRKLLEEGNAGNNPYLQAIVDALALQVENLGLLFFTDEAIGFVTPQGPGRSPK